MTRLRVLLVTFVLVGSFVALPAKAEFTCETTPDGVSVETITSEWISVSVGIPGVTISCTEFERNADGRVVTAVTRDYIEDMGAYIGGLYKFLAGAIGIIAATMVFYGGIKWIAAAGNASKIKDAKETVFSALIAVVICLGSYLLLYVINPKLVSLRPPSLAVVDAIYQRFGGLCPTDKFCLSGPDEGKKCTGDAGCAGGTNGICGLPYTLHAGETFAQCGTMYDFLVVKGVANAGEKCMGGGCSGDGLCRRSATNYTEGPSEEGAACVGSSGICTSKTTNCEQWSVAGVGACKQYTSILDGAGQTEQRCAWYPVIKCPVGMAQVGCGVCNSAGATCADFGGRTSICEVTATTTPVYQGGPYLPAGTSSPAICCQSTTLPPQTVCKSS